MKRIVQISLVILFTIIIQSTLSANLNEYIKTSELCTIIKKNNIHKLSKKCSKYLIEVQSFEVIKKKFNNMNNNEEKRKLFQIYAKELRNINAKIKPIGYSIDNYILSNYKSNNKQTLKNIDIIFSSNSYITPSYVLKDIVTNNGGNLNLSSIGLNKIKIYLDKIEIKRQKELKDKARIAKGKKLARKKQQQKERKTRKAIAKKKEIMQAYNAKYGKSKITVFSSCKFYAESPYLQSKSKLVRDTYQEFYDNCLKKEGKAKQLLNENPFNPIKIFCEQKGLLSNSYTNILSCMKTQNKAKEYLELYKHPRKNIMNFCKDKWGNNYRMVKSCYFDDDTDDKYTLSIASSEVKSRCKIKWGYDTKMFNYCVLQQQHSKASVKSTSNDEVRQQCERKWGDNYKMAEYCIKEQNQAKRELQNYSSSTKNMCEQKWGINYKMVLYCIRK